jgi:hypothetical protein
LSRNGTLREMIFQIRKTCTCESEFRLESFVSRPENLFVLNGDVEGTVHAIYIFIVKCLSKQVKKLPSLTVKAMRRFDGRRLPTKISKLRALQHVLVIQYEY